MRAAMYQAQGLRAYLDRARAGGLPKVAPGVERLKARGTSSGELRENDVPRPGLAASPVAYSGIFGGSGMNPKGLALGSAYMTALYQITHHNSLRSRTDISGCVTMLGICMLSSSLVIVKLQLEQLTAVVASTRQGQMARQRPICWVFSLWKTFK